MSLCVRCVLWGDFHQLEVKKALPSMSCIRIACQVVYLTLMFLGVLLESLEVRSWDLFMSHS